MDYVKKDLNLDAASSSLATIRKLHAIGLASDADLCKAEGLAVAVVERQTREQARQSVKVLGLSRRVVIKKQPVVALRPVGGRLEHA